MLNTLRNGTTLTQLSGNGINEKYVQNVKYEVKSCSIIPSFQALLAKLRVNHGSYQPELKGSGQNFASTCS